MILLYWIYMIVVLLGTKLLGYSDDHKLTIIIIVVATLIYAGAMYLIMKAQGAVAENPQFYERDKKGGTQQKMIADKKSSTQKSRKSGKYAEPKNGRKPEKKNKKK